MFAQRDEPMSYRQYRYPPLQRTQGRGTHSCVSGEETKNPRRGHPPFGLKFSMSANAFHENAGLRQVDFDFALPKIHLPS